MKNSRGAGQHKWLVATWIYTSICICTGRYNSTLLYQRFGQQMICRTFRQKYYTWPSLLGIISVFRPQDHQHVKISVLAKPGQSNHMLLSSPVRSCHHQLSSSQYWSTGSSQSVDLKLVHLFIRIWVGGDSYFIFSQWFFSPSLHCFVF